MIILAVANLINSGVGDCKSPALESGLQIRTNFGTGWTSASATNDYKEDISYDGNGNILTYLRNGAAATNTQALDNLTYNYSKDANNRLINNKLNSISDAVSNSNYTGGDITNQTNATNYRYDAIGNLIYDNASGITGNDGTNAITWSVYGKIQGIYKSGSTITYTYDAAQHRVSKTSSSLTTYYVRDAQGNTLAVYDNAGSNSNWREQTLYGSSRLGIYTPNLIVPATPPTVYGTITNFTIGQRFYELSNHLGNVIATISDRRVQAGVTNGLPNQLPDVATAQDYYPFGMLQPNRQYTANSTTYRYGFNGKENDNDVGKGTGNQQDYGMRIYDPRIGKFLSVDPIGRTYPMLTPYQFAGNRVIQVIDRDGLEPAKPEEGKKNLLIVIQGYVQGNPEDNETQTKNTRNPALKNDDALGQLGVDLSSKFGDLQTATFASSTSKNTRSDVIKTIQLFRSASPNGKVIAVGHSLGGENLIQALAESKTTKVDLLISIDTHNLDINYFPFKKITRDVFSNVKNTINYHQITSFGLSGYYLNVVDPKQTKGVDIRIKGVGHTEIDNALYDRGILENNISKFLTGKDPLGDAKKQPVLDFSIPDKKR